MVKFFIEEMRYMVFDLLGLIGMVLVFQVINLIAAIFMAIGLLPKNAWFSFALQVAWAIIAIISIVKIIHKEKE